MLKVDYERINSNAVFIPYTQIKYLINKAKITKAKKDREAAEAKAKAEKEAKEAEKSKKKNDTTDDKENTEKDKEKVVVDKEGVEEQQQQESVGDTKDSQKTGQ